MSALGALGGQLVLFALSLLLMQAALRWGRGRGLFAALPLGVLPALVVAAATFWQVQQRNLPEIKEARLSYQAQVEKMSTQYFPKAEDSAQRDDFKDLLMRFFEVGPALEFCFHLGLIAVMAVMLRRRYARAGLLPVAEPLMEWTAPWILAWLVLAPVFLVVAQTRGLIAIDNLWLLLAQNVLVVGLAIFLFQGMVVALAKLRAWWVVPRTRALVFLALAAVFASFLIQNGQMLFVILLFMGLFEPWMDSRRLRQKPSDPGEKP